MVKRHEAHLLRVKIVAAGTDVQKDACDLSNDSDRVSDMGACASDDPDVVASRLLEGEADEKGKPIEMIWDPLPLIGGIDGPQDREEDGDWARAGAAERLSAAGAAAPAPDASGNHDGSNASGRWAFGVHFNPKGYPESVVHYSEYEEGSGEKLVWSKCWGWCRCCSER